MIKVKGLSKDFGDKKALSNINLDFREGCIHGIVGVNGSGKSTLLKCMSGVYKGDIGSVSINDMIVFENTKVKELLTYIEDENDFFYSYKVKDVIKFYEKTYQKFSKSDFSKLNNTFNIPLNIRVKSLSKGQKMRLSIMLGLSSKPKVLFLDEPTNGLDPLIKKEFFKILGDYIYENKATAVIASHHLSELERISDSITLIDNGVVKYSLKLDELKNNVRKIQVLFNEEVKISHPSIVSVEKVGRIHYLVTNKYDLSIIRYIESFNPEFIEEVDMSLEDMFEYTVGGEYSELY